MRDQIAVRIASGASQSGEVNVGGRRIVGVQMPVGWDAAGITFLALLREAYGPPKVPVFGMVQAEGGGELTVTTPAADEYVVLNAIDIIGLGRIKVRSGTAGAPVNQTAQRDFFLVVV